MRLSERSPIRRCRYHLPRFDRIQFLDLADGHVRGMSAIPGEEPGLPEEQLGIGAAICPQSNRDQSVCTLHPTHKAAEEEPGCGIDPLNVLEGNNKTAVFRARRAPISQRFDNEVAFCRWVNGKGRKAFVWFEAEKLANQ